MITLTVELADDLTAYAACWALMRLSDKIEAHVKASFNGILLSTEPYDSVSEMIAGYEQALRLSQYPQS